MVSASQIASVVQQFATVFVFGIANAAAVVIGNAVGEGDMEKAGQRADWLKITSLAVGAFSAGLILLIRPLALDFIMFPTQLRLWQRICGNPGGNRLFCVHYRRGNCRNPQRRRRYPFCFGNRFVYPLVCSAAGRPLSACVQTAGAGGICFYQIGRAGENGSDFLGGCATAIG